MVVVVMGVTGAGKSTVGGALAAALGWRFHDADALHDAADVARMARGEPLTDAQRGPWLARVRRVIAETLEADADAVVACSALKEEYRRQLGADDARVFFVFLDADPAVLRQRLAQRVGHFAGVSLLGTQLATLERPRHVLTVDAGRPVAELVAEIRRELSRGSSPPRTR